MALIRNFDRKDHERQTVHDEIKATYTSFRNDDGSIFLQINSYGRDSRAVPGKQSQVIQLDREGAFSLFNILKQEFHFE
ncbi:MAG: methionyl-tRNA formyltransferase [Alphaproteobacteria bacterium]